MGPQGFVEHSLEMEASLSIGCDPDDDEMLPNSNLTTTSTYCHVLTIDRV
jgi:hypothetical protein